MTIARIKSDQSIPACLTNFTDFRAVRTRKTPAAHLRLPFSDTNTNYAPVAAARSEKATIQKGRRWIFILKAWR